MEIGLIQIDGKIPNLALMKLSTYHKSKGDNVLLMRDKKVKSKKEFIALASWGNMMGAFKQDLKSLLKKSKRLKSYEQYFDMEVINKHEQINYKFND